MSNEPLGLDRLTDQPEIVETIGGQKYGFSELTLEARGRLQAWIKANLADPMESIKASLDGLTQEDRNHLLNEARKEKRDWPPDLSTNNGRLAILSNDHGQTELFFEALKIHHPEITRPGAYKVMRQLKREIASENERDKRAGKKTRRLNRVDRIIGVMLAIDLPDEDDEPAPKFPKDMELQRKNGLSTGSSYSSAASNS
jgi:hypothetical protein